MARLFIFRWAPGDGPQERRCRALWRRIEPDRDWVKFIDRRGVLAFFALAPGDTSPILLEREQGGVFGPLFARDDPGEGPLQRLDQVSTKDLIEGAGEILTRKYWGPYAAVLHDRARDLLRVVREPCGGGAIFFAPLFKPSQGAQAIFTHASDFLALADKSEPDLDFLSAFMAAPRLVTSRTAIADVTEVLAGQEWSFPRDMKAIEGRSVWAPTPNAASFGPDQFDAASALLRNAVLDCARSWARVRPLIVHRLSGGLDSSVALTALSRAGGETGAKVIAVNEYSSAAPEGDERKYARAAAAFADARLVEIEIAPTGVDYARLLDCDLTAKPSRAELSFSDVTLPTAIEAIDAGALITSGQGGDQVFHRSRQPHIAADAWRDGLRLDALANIARDTATLSRRPIWDVFAAMLAHGAFRRPFKPGGKLRDLAGFDEGAGKAIAEASMADHPWGLDLKRASPARALRISHIMDLQYYHQRDALSSRFLTAPVLASQPVVDLCLNIPPYVMIAGGRERALARAAFRDLAPELVLKRTGKGDTTRFHTAVIERQFTFMREMLVGGELETNGIVASAPLQAVLKRDVLPKAATSTRVSSALLAEVWLRRFYAERQIARANRIAFEARALEETQGKELEAGESGGDPASGEAAA